MYNTISPRVTLPEVKTTFTECDNGDLPIHVMFNPGRTDMTSGYVAGRPWLRVNNLIRVKSNRTGRWIKQEWANAANNRYINAVIEAIDLYENKIDWDFVDNDISVIESKAATEIKAATETTFDTIPEDNSLEVIEIARKTYDPILQECSPNHPLIDYRMDYPNDRQVASIRFVMSGNTYSIVIHNDISEVADAILRKCEEHNIHETFAVIRELHEERELVVA